MSAYVEAPNFIILQVSIASPLMKERTRCLERLLLSLIVFAGGDPYSTGESMQPLGLVAPSILLSVRLRQYQIRGHS